MAVKKKCCSAGETKVLLVCAGASNVGQLTNDVAKQLASAGEACFFCLAGIGGHVSGMIASVRGADKVVVLDGCPGACAKKTMDAAGLKDYEHLVVTDLGIEKQHTFEISKADFQKTLEAARKRLVCASGE